MHVFVTGATGWVGSAIVEDLLRAGHQVSGLARSESKAQELAKTGAKVVKTTLDDFSGLRAAASDADAVIHTAFNHDFMRSAFNHDFFKFKESAAQDRQVIELLGSAIWA